jgi:hypothetical protein
MYSLWVVGPFFEQLWGRVRFLFLYLIAGLGGSCAMVISNVHNGLPGLLGAGASGAIWGILAAYAVWILANRRYLPGPMASRMLRQVIFVFVINVALTFGVANISASAHFGGGAIGAITALLLHWHRYGGFLQRRLAFLGVVAIPVLCITAVVEAQRLDPHWQEARLRLRGATIAEVYWQARRQAQAIHDKDVQPLLRQKLKAHSLQEVDEAVADLQRGRAILSEGITDLQQAGPFQEKELDDERQELIQDLERRSSSYAVIQLQELILPLLADARRRATLTYDQQWRILQQKEKDGKLTPEEVEQAIAPCRKAREEVEAGVALLRRAGPYQEHRIERTRLRALHEEEERIQGWKDTEQRWQERTKKDPLPSM